LFSFGIIILALGIDFKLILSFLVNFGSWPLASETSSRAASLYSCAFSKSLTRRPCCCFAASFTVRRSSRCSQDSITRARHSVSVRVSVSRRVPARLSDTLPVRHRRTKHEFLVLGGGFRGTRVCRFRFARCEAIAMVSSRWNSGAWISLGYLALPQLDLHTGLVRNCLPGGGPRLWSICGGAYWHVAYWDRDLTALRFTCVLFSDIWEMRDIRARISQVPKPKEASRI
jgi:hypothetical protein